jgi:5-methyltetrahydropteroyltriglutamate--homocysteine methyltransferase
MSGGPLTTASMFPTFVVGSLPRPRWLQGLIFDRRDRRISHEAANQLLDDAVPMAIRMQERAGLDVISDGEWRRESYIKVVSENVGGFEDGAMPSLTDGPSDPAVVSRLEARGSVATDAAKFLKHRTAAQVIVTLPSPYILGWRMWEQTVSGPAYATREEFMAACALILRNEVRALSAAGIDHIQIDEPWLLMAVDERHRSRMGMGALEGEILAATRRINDVVADAGDTPTSVHLCHGHFRRKRYADGGYEPIIEALGDINVNRFAMEFAAPESHGTGSLALFTRGKVLGLGVVDQVTPEIESAEMIVNRVESAMRYVEAERITLNPDCGFSPSSQNPMDLDEAYLKLREMCRAADILRA